MVTYFKDVFNGIFTVLIGMMETWKHLFRPATTLQYPHVRFELPPGTRMQLFNNVDDCIGCYKCARICPVDCIYIDTVKAKPTEDLGKASTGNPIRQHVVRFDIDMFKCCYCDLCTTVCPTECLYMTDKYEATVYERSNGIFHFSKYEPALAAKMLAEQALEEAAAAAAKAAKAAAAPAKPKPEAKEHAHA
ncbi:4Fe-4S dicluster domain-containing protein [candidate division KSB1 bacterium]|nr:MAG: 4Fe-4S dicluster domain-containing protein [candidate division KSB1 bacterium]MBC6951093.1 4Fe-4S dicluster domain-containing protein [candidate division KSB1 bacterium]MCE7940401.1 4Fe-4S dicluster domain-containing protein [Chlorobi bacterium CHB1]MDL1875567.1 4Fe-4S dicluster domain-containing protein [Cytophagia bacterium CHB2]